jgi:hypothetical protein
MVRFGGVLTRGPLVVLGLAGLGLVGVALAFNVHSLANALLCGVCLFLAFQALVMWVSVRYTNPERLPDPKNVWNFFSVFCLMVGALLVAAVVAMIAEGGSPGGNLLALVATTMGFIAVVAWVWRAAQFCAEARGMN